MKLKIIAFLLITIISLGLFGCKKDDNTPTNTTSTLYDEEILYIVDDNIDEHCYLFFRDGIAVAMDIVKYYDKQEYIDGNWDTLADDTTDDFCSTYFSSAIEPSTKSLMCQYNNLSDSEYTRAKFYESFLGKCPPFIVSSINNKFNIYEGQEYDDIIGLRTQISSIISIEQLTFSWQ